jgi:hypothetical protein
MTGSTPSSFNWTQTATFLEDAAALVQSPAVTAIAGLAGPQAAGVVKLVQGLAGISSSVLATSTVAVEAIQSGDLAKIQAADATIQAANAALAAQVAAS